MGDVIELRTEAQVNADYTLTVAKLGDLQLRVAAFVNKSRNDEQELIKKAQELSQEMDALKAPKPAPVEAPAPAPVAPAEPIPDVPA